MERPGTTEIAFSRPGAPGREVRVLLGRLEHSPVHNEHAAIAHLPAFGHSAPSLVFPSSQELCTSLGSAKGSGAVGLLPISGRQNLPGI